MELKIIFAITLILASAEGIPTTEVEPNNNSTTNNTNLRAVDNLRSNDATQDISAVVIIGKNNGEMLRCSYKSPDSCMMINKASYAITSTIVYGEYIYAGLNSGVMWRCDLYKPHSCSDFNSAGTAINALAVSGRYIYAGLYTGIIWQCKINQADSCSTYYVAERAVRSLAATEDYLFAGLASGQMLRCELKGKIRCTVINTAGTPITALAVMGNTIYGGTSAGTMWKCNALVSDSCIDLNTAGAEITSLSIFNRLIYAVLGSGMIWSCSLDTARSCWVYKNLDQARSIANVYGYTPLNSKYTSENVRCSWQSKLKCPPYIVYYNLEDRLTLEMRIINGKVYNSQGVLFDTSIADQSHSGIAAIFVMEPSGRILISNTHKVYLLHHSSLMAGNPVAAAGEMKIKQGVITDITTCSGHYHPSLILNTQVLQSLYFQGYTNAIEVKDCLVRIEY